MKVPIINPPHRRKRKRKAVKSFGRKRRMSAKARKAAIRNLRKARLKIKQRRKFRNRPARRRHARRVRKTRRARRKVRRFKNPFGGELLMLGNPKKRKSHRRKKRMARRKHRRRYSNPLSPSAILEKPKQLLKADFAMEAVAVTGGFVLPGMVMNYVPTAFRDQPWKFYVSKVAVVSLLATAGSMIKPRIGRMVLLGGGVSILMDIFSTFMAGRTTAAPTTTKAYYGPGIHAYYGDLDTSGDALATDTGELIDDSEGSSF